MNIPTYRIVVTEHTHGPKSSNFVEKLGTYNPKTKVRVLDSERVKYWLSVGAQASGTMHNMLISAGIIEGKKVNVLPKKSPPAKESEQKTDSTGRAQAENSEQENTKAKTPIAEIAEEKTEEQAPAEEAKPEAPAETSAPVETAEAKQE